MINGARNRAALDAPDPGEPVQDRPSKTRQKQAMHELQALGARLVELNAAQLAAIDLPEALRGAVSDAQRIRSHEARRRQMQFIGRLMRAVDPEPIRERLAVWDGRARAHAACEHELARWRERLIEDEAALAQFASSHRDADLQRLRTLVRNTRAEREAGRPPRSYRELYRALREAMKERHAVMRAPARNDA